jgi:hypothetical protein
MEEPAMIPTVIRRIAVLNWIAASVFVLAMAGVEQNALAAVGVMAVFMVLAFVAAALVTNYRAAALTVATILVLGSLVLLSVGLLVMPTSLVTFGAVIVAISRAASGRRAGAAA